MKRDLLRRLGAVGAGGEQHRVKQLSSERHAAFRGLFMFPNLVIHLVVLGDDCSWKITQHREALTI